MANRIPFGVKAKDKITGFEGTVTGHSDFITGCDQFFLQPTVDDKGAKREGQWFDENRLEVLNAPAINLEPIKTAEPLRRAGCDTPLPRCN